jgi:hypothetical protein
MSDGISIAVTIFGIVAEATAFVLIARHRNRAILSWRWILPCAGIAFGIAVILAIIFVEIGWGFNEYGHNALFLLPVLLVSTGAAIAAFLTGLSLAASGILAVVRWLNWRDDPERMNAAVQSPDSVIRRD